MRSFKTTLVAMLLLVASSTMFAQPANDSCTTPLLIIPPVPGMLNWPFNTTTATDSVGLTGCAQMDRDVWYSIVAPFDGVMEVKHNWNPMQHAVYLVPAGQTCPLDLDQIYCDQGSNQNSSYTPAIMGETYMVRLGRGALNTTTGAYEGGTGNITVRVLPPPANDACSAPAIVGALPTSLPYDTTGSSGTPGLNCNVNRDVWYQLTVPADGLISVNTNDCCVDVAVYSSSGGGACPSNADEIYCGGGQSTSFQALVGEIYLFRVGYAFGNGFAIGNLSINQTFVGPANDDCAGAQTVTFPSSVNFDTTGALPDTHGLTCNLNDDLWYQFTAPGNGSVNVILSGGIDMRHEVYLAPGGTGVCPSNADRVGGCWTTNNTWTTVTSGLVYMIRLGRGQAGPTSGLLSLAFAAAATNDDCTTPIALTIPSTATVSNVGATPDASGLGCLTHGDTWYSFTPPASGLLNLDFGQFVKFAIYLGLPGVCPVSGDQIVCDQDDLYQLNVTAGTGYLLRISTQNQFPPVTTSLALEILAPPPNDDCALGAATLVTVPTTAPVVWENLAGTNDVNGYSCNVTKDLWYRFVAPTTGCMYYVDTTQDNFALFFDSTGGAGCPLQSDQMVCDTQGLTFQSAEFQVLAGQSYLLRLGGFNTNPADGAFTLEYILGDPQGVFCDASVPDQVTASYQIPLGNDYDLGVDVTVDGVMVATIPQTQLSYLHTLTPAFVGTVIIGFTGRSTTLGTSDETICAVSVNGAPNDLCTGALVVGVGSHPFDNTVSVLDLNADPSVCTRFDDPWNDLWYSFTPPLAQLYTISVCSTTIDVEIELWDGTVGCPGPLDDAFDCSFGNECSITLTGNPTSPILIRVVGQNSSFGTGTLEIQPDCAALTGLTCDYDCVLDQVVLGWTGGSHDTYDVVSDLLLVGGGLTIASTVDVNPAPGLRTYTVTGFCLNGAALSAQCEVHVPDLDNPGTDLILRMEGLLDNGNTGLIDSAIPLRSALSASGRTVSELRVEDFDQWPCLTTLTGPAEIVWVLAGTFPRDYRLSAAEGDLLASLAAQGKAIYLEGGDHWNFNHVASNLDLRDGVESNNPTGNINNGNDLFTAMIGLDAGLPDGDFSGFTQTGYFQDSAQNESTDQLVVSGTDMTGTYPPDPAQAGAIWRNADDTQTGEALFLTGVLAVSDVDGGRMISTSWEFGGFTGDIVQLAQAYLSALIGTGPQEMLIRGDTNGDGSVNIADAVYLLGNLFPGAGVPNPLNCLEAADGNNDGGINIADAVAILSSLFGSPTIPLPAPHPTCGPISAAPNQTGIGCAVSTCP